MSLHWTNLARRRALAALMTVWGVCMVPRAHAAPAETPEKTPEKTPEESIDDPKIARRLGNRADWPPPPATPPAPGVQTPPSSVLPASAPGPTLATAPLAAPPLPATPANETGFQPVLPRAQLAFRRFDFVRIGASNGAGLAAPEAFDSLSIDVYPVSSLVRLGLSTAYGWQEGMTSGGDYFAAETASFGAQLPMGRVVPFAEGLAGVGYLRRIQFDRGIPTVFWQLGIDVGASLYLARIGFVSLALGYLHPVNGFAKQTSFESVYTNTWSFKIGVGI
jgi:hypothetical protein